MDAVSNFVEACTKLITNGGLLFGFFLIFLESIIPLLPLGVFVALNINAFGFILGIIVSWLATCIGGYLTYLLFFYLSNNIIYKLIEKSKKKKLQKAVNKFKQIPLANLVVIITLPFTPSFLINILSGIAGIRKEKFLIALLIGKMFMIIFWGYVGKSLIESMTDIKTIIVISLMLLVAYFISKFVGRKMNIE